jgi:putative addiction module antidote
MAELKLIGIGNSVGVILPREMLVKLGLQKGDTVHAIETENGLRLTVADPDFEAQMEVARRIMKERRAVLRELAK